MKILKCLAAVSLLGLLFSGCSVKQQTVHSLSYKGKPVSLLVTKHISNEQTIKESTSKSNEIKAEIHMISLNNEWKGDKSSIVYPPGDYLSIATTMLDSARFPKSGEPIDLSKKITIEIDAEKESVYCGLASEYDFDVMGLGDIYYNEINCEIEKETIKKISNSKSPVYIKFNGKNGYSGSFIIKEEVKPELLKHFNAKLGNSALPNGVMYRAR